MNNLLCGASKVCITPPAELIPKLYGLMGCHFAGVIDDIHVRVMAIANETAKALFVAWDLDKAPNPDTFVPEIAQRTGVPEQNILFWGVHTHTAPSHSARPNDGPNAKARQTPERQEATNAFEAILHDKMLEAVDSAIAAMVPAKIGWGLGESYVGDNRVQDYYAEQEDGSVIRMTSIGSNPKGACDRTLFVMKAESLDGSPIAFLVNHAVHCCVMIMNNFDGEGGVGISADLAGQVSTLLEQKFPGCTALWCSGAAGDINPVMLNQYNYADPATGAPMESRDFHTAEPAKMMLFTLSRRQFADVLAVVRDIKCDTGSADITAAMDIASCPANDGSGHPSTDTTYDVRLKAVKLANIIFCGASGELYGSLGKAIQEISSAAHTVVINHECSLAFASGYIFDDDALERTLRPDGTRDGLPNANHTKMIPGYFKPALEQTAENIFKKL